MQHHPPEAEIAGEVAGHWPSLTAQFSRLQHRWFGAGSQFGQFPSKAPVRTQKLKNRMSRFQRALYPVPAVVVSYRRGCDER
jgi:hypothetical protein